MARKELTAAQVRGNLPPGSYTDRDGLTLRVASSGNKQWVQRITINHKQASIGLGTFPAVGLSDARRAAADNRSAVQQGLDPRETKQQERQEAAARAAIPTFQEVAETVIELRRPTWSSDRHVTQWTESLAKYAFPVIGRKRVDTVTTADLLAVLTPIWVDHPETSTRVKQRIGKVLDYAIANGWRADNPAGGVLNAVLPRRPRLKAHHRALPYADIAEAMKTVRESNADTVTRLAFEFLVLTVARAGEVREAVWSEIDLDTRTWTVPAARMKARREHRVPLSGRAVEVLTEARECSRGKGLVFPSKRSGRPLSNMAFTALLKRLNIDAVPHGFRSTFKDWTIEQTATPWAVGEAALAHILGNSVEAAYARTDAFDRRRALMEEWANFIDGNKPGSLPVLGFRPLTSISSQAGVGSL